VPDWVPVSPKQLGARVAQARIRVDLKQEALADAVGLSRPFISEVERGLVSPRVEDLERIANACKTTLAHLLDARMPAKYAMAHAETHGQLQEILDAKGPLADAAITLIKSLFNELHRLRQGHLKSKAI
jgi:transcriptional regulator with XRE-family HTH domain